MSDPRSLRSNPHSAASTHNSLGSDEPTSPMWKIFYSLVGYVSLAFLSEYLNKTKTGIIEPQADMGTTQIEQNVTFIDDQPGMEDDYGSTIDSLRDAPMTSEHSLNDFFSRPIRIGTVDWNVGEDLNSTYLPWFQYFSNPRVVNRLANYKLLSAELCVKAVINGNPFHYGRAILAYNPLVGYDEFTPDRELFLVDIVGLSQRPHIYIDPSTCQGGCLSLPFCWPGNTLDVTSDHYDESGINDFMRMGQLQLKSLAQLKHVGGALDSATIDIFVWAKNVKYSVLTHVTPQFIVPQADEYTGSGVISKPAFAVSNYLSKVSAPVIQPYITATAMGAKLVGGLAGLFGYSRPVMLKSSRFQINTKHNMASTNLEDDVAKLSVDAKQEVTIDPCAYGLSTKDEMDISYIASRESYLTTFGWSPAKSQEELIYNWIVDPMIVRRLSVGGREEMHMSAINFASIPFGRWRGSIKYRFQVVCSKFHRGRLKVVYDPSRTVEPAEYNTANTTIVDISNTTDFEVVVGWGQATTYRKMGDITNPENFSLYNLPLDYDSNSNDFGNGTLAVYVVTELTSPNTTINNDIRINVFISAGDDFELAMPTGDIITRLRLSDPTLIVPQMDEGNTVANDSMGVPANPTTVSVMGNTMPTTDPANLMHFGESIRSFRQMIKRYNLHEVIPPTRSTALINGTAYLFQIQRPSFPFEPGYSPNAVLSQTSRVPMPIGATPNAKFYAYSNMTLLRYLSTAYVGWRGGVRYLVDTGALGCGCTSLGPTVVSRSSECAPADIFGGHPSPTTNSGQSLMLQKYDDASGVDGFIVQNNNVNPTLAFEVPYYSEKRFSPCRTFTNFDLVGKNFSPCWKLKLPYWTGPDSAKLTSTTVTTFVAAAEDFSFGFFIGAPIFYYEPFPPS